MDIVVFVRLRHKIWVAYKAKSAPLPKNWLEASTARGTLFTSFPRSQHSGIIRKQQVFSYSESALAIGGMLRMSVHSCSILSEREAYDMWVLYQSAVQLCMFFQAINALQEPTPNWTNLRRNVSKMSEMSQKFNDSKVVGKVPQRSDASQNDHKSKGYSI